MKNDYRYVDPDYTYTDAETGVRGDIDGLAVLIFECLYR
jgi:hypothetical protein